MQLTEENTVGLFCPQDQRGYSQKLKKWQIRCEVTAFPQNSLTIPWHFVICIFSLTSFKIPWQFPDILKKYFSLTRGNPERCWPFCQASGISHSLSSPPPPYLYLVWFKHILFSNWITRKSYTNPLKYRTCRSLLKKRCVGLSDKHGDSLSSLPPSLFPLSPLLTPNIPPLPPSIYLSCVGLSASPTPSPLSLSPLLTPTIPPLPPSLSPYLLFIDEEEVLVFLPSMVTLSPLSPSPLPLSPLLTPNIPPLPPSIHVYLSCVGLSARQVGIYLSLSLSLSLTHPLPLSLNLSLLVFHWWRRGAGLSARQAGISLSLSFSLCPSLNISPSPPYCSLMKKRCIDLSDKHGDSLLYLPPCSISPFSLSLSLSLSPPPCCSLMKKRCVGLSDKHGDSLLSTSLPAPSLPYSHSPHPLSLSLSLSLDLFLSPLLTCFSLMKKRCWSFCQAWWLSLLSTSLTAPSLSLTHPHSPSLPTCFSLMKKRCWSFCLPLSLSLPPTLSLSRLPVFHWWRRDVGLSASLSLSLSLFLPSISLSAPTCFSLMKKRCWSFCQASGESAENVDMPGTKMADTTELESTLNWEKIGLEDWGVMTTTEEKDCWIVLYFLYKFPQNFLYGYI